jgi:hypothetical protein
MVKTMINNFLNRQQGFSLIEVLRNENITDFGFTYFDTDGAATMVTQNIRSVSITLTATTPAGSAAPVERTYNTLIRCRNIGL